MIVTPDLTTLLEQAIRQRIDAIIEEELIEVKSRVAKRARAEVGTIAATVLSRFSYEQQGQTLVIKVDFSNP